MIRSEQNSWTCIKTHVAFAQVLNMGTHSSPIQTHEYVIRLWHCSNGL